MENKNLLELKSISQSFIKPDRTNQVILQNIDFSLQSGEIVAILGKSGSGKSTLLRIIAGLNKPAAGEIRWNIKNDAQNFGMSMIFQSFALFPWLTVFENVELGLETMDLSGEERKQRTLKLIDLIGLDGFESAYPRELSGGMKQRVGFARSLVVSPEILLMDEPFSALDILTASTLKSDFMELWFGKKTQLKSVIIVTHSIEEAVLMADRVVVLGANPGRLVSELKIKLPHPRNLQSEEFHDIVDEIYTLMSDANEKNKTNSKDVSNIERITQKLPQVSPNQLTALATAIIAQSHGGKASLANLSKILALNASNLIHMAEAFAMLQLATIKDGDINLTEKGLRFALDDIEERKRIFGELFLHNIPIIGHICKTLKENSTHTASFGEFLDLLETKLSHHDAVIILRTAIIWGRYANLFAYDAKSQKFVLSDENNVH